MVLYERVDSPLGGVLLAAHDERLCGVWFEGQKYYPPLRGWRPASDSALLGEAAAQLKAYFEGRLRAFDLPLSLARGTPFQQQVWQALRTIDAGQTLTYGELARRLQRPRAVRAVAAAVGRNPLSVVVPCHRVLGANGSLTGYAGGLDRKARLLALEGHQGAWQASGKRAAGR
ncbi:methylated-DNA--[protein]-cysteine S-methyltransferase [Alloalcanivorax mobilis]|uniref:methylated-DNA--[protein]-cysteine S-methyltransferase n=1 Tax=Alloalcanivorax mobilis TaxID=2019569 RepID=UPI000C76EFAF|nr:methylated-DNA--[protein]-cysteine S-methyltransferase [Alloalcanivorax mobilis]